MIVAFAVTTALAASSTDFSLSCTIFPLKLRLTVSWELLQTQENRVLWRCKVFVSLSHSILCKTVSYLFLLHADQRFPPVNLCSFLDKASESMDGGNSANSALYLNCAVKQECYFCGVPWWGPGTGCVWHGAAPASPHRGPAALLPAPWHVNPMQLLSRSHILKFLSVLGSCTTDSSFGRHKPSHHLATLILKVYRVHRARLLYGGGPCKQNLRI